MVYWEWWKGFKVLYFVVVENLCKLTLKFMFVFLMASFGKNYEVRSALQTNGELVFTGVDLKTGHEIFNLAFYNTTPGKPETESEFDNLTEYN